MAGWIPPRHQRPASAPTRVPSVRRCGEAKFAPVGSAVPVPQGHRRWDKSSQVAAGEARNLPRLPRESALSPPSTCLPQAAATLGESKAGKGRETVLGRRDGTLAGRGQLAAHRCSLLRRYSRGHWGEATTSAVVWRSDSQRPLWVRRMVLLSTQHPRQSACVMSRSGLEWPDVGGPDL